MESNTQFVERNLHSNLFLGSLIQHAKESDTVKSAPGSKKSFKNSFKLSTREIELDKWRSHLQVHFWNKNSTADIPKHISKAVQNLENSLGKKMYGCSLSVNGKPNALITLKKGINESEQVKVHTSDVSGEEFKSEISRDFDQTLQNKIVQFNSCSGNSLILNFNMREHFYRLNDDDMKFGSVIKRGFLLDIESDMNEQSWLALKQNLQNLDAQKKFEPLIDWVLPLRSSKSRLVVRPTRFEKFVESVFGNDSNLKDSIQGLVKAAISQLSNASGTFNKELFSHASRKAEIDRVLFIEKIGDSYTAIQISGKLHKFFQDFKLDHQLSNPVVAPFKLQPFSNLAGKGQNTDQRGRANTSRDLEVPKTDYENHSLIFTEDGVINAKMGDSLETVPSSKIEFLTGGLIKVQETVYKISGLDLVKTQDQGQKIESIPKSVFLETRRTSKLTPNLIPSPIPPPLVPGKKITFPQPPNNIQDETSESLVTPIKKPQTGEDDQSGHLDTPQLTNPQESSPNLINPDDFPKDLLIKKKTESTVNQKHPDNLLTPTQGLTSDQDRQNIEVSPLGDLTINKIDSADKHQKNGEETPEKSLSKKLSQASLSSVDKLVIGYEARSALEEMELKILEFSNIDTSQELTPQQKIDTGRSEPSIAKQAESTRRLQTLEEDSDIDTDEMIMSQLEKNDGTRSSNAELTARTIEQQNEDLEQVLEEHSRRNNKKDKSESDGDGDSDSSQVELKNENRQKDPEDDDDERNSGENGIPKPPPVPQAQLVLLIKNDVEKKKVDEQKRLSKLIPRPPDLENLELTEQQKKDQLDSEREQRLKIPKPPDISVVYKLDIEREEEKKKKQLERVPDAPLLYMAFKNLQDKIKKEKQLAEEEKKIQDAIPKAPDIGIVIRHDTELKEKVEQDKLTRVLPPPPVTILDEVAQKKKEEREAEKAKLAAIPVPPDLAKLYIKEFDAKLSKDYEKLAKVPPPPDLSVVKVTEEQKKAEREQEKAKLSVIPTPPDISNLYIREFDLAESKKYEKLSKVPLPPDLDIIKQTEEQKKLEREQEKEKLSAIPTPPDIASLYIREFDLAESKKYEKLSKVPPPPPLINLLPPIAPVLSNLAPAIPRVDDEEDNSSFEEELNIGGGKDEAEELRINQRSTEFLEKLKIVNQKMDEHAVNYDAEDELSSLQSGTLTDRSHMTQFSAISTNQKDQVKKIGIDESPEKKFNQDSELKTEEAKSIEKPTGIILPPILPIPLPPSVDALKSIELQKKEELDSEREKRQAIIKPPDISVVYKLDIEREEEMKKKQLERVPEAPLLYMAFKNLQDKIKKEKQLAEEEKKIQDAIPKAPDIGIVIRHDTELKEKVEQDKLTRVLPPPPVTILDEVAQKKKEEREAEKAKLAAIPVPPDLAKLYIKEFDAKLSKDYEKLAKVPPPPPVTILDEVEQKKKQEREVEKAKLSSIPTPPDISALYIREFDLKLSKDYEKLAKVPPPPDLVVVKQTEEQKKIEREQEKAKLSSIPTPPDISTLYIREFDIQESKKYEKLAKVPAPPPIDILKKTPEVSEAALDSQREQAAPVIPGPPIMIPPPLLIPPPLAVAKKDDTKEESKHGDEKKEVAAPVILPPPPIKILDEIAQKSKEEREAEKAIKEAIPKAPDIGIVIRHDTELKEKVEQDKLTRVLPPPPVTILDEVAQKKKEEREAEKAKLASIPVPPDLAKLYIKEFDAKLSKDYEKLAKVPPPPDLSVVKVIEEKKKAEREQEKEKLSAIPNPPDISTLYIREFDNKLSRDYEKLSKVPLPPDLDIIKQTEEQKKIERELEKAKISAIPTPPDLSALYIREFDHAESIKYEKLAKVPPPPPPIIKQELSDNSSGIIPPLPKNLIPYPPKIPIPPQQNVSIPNPSFIPIPPEECGPNATPDILNPPVSPPRLILSSPNKQVDPRLQNVPAPPPIIPEPPKVENIPTPPPMPVIPEPPKVQSIPTPPPVPVIPVPPKVENIPTPPPMPVIPEPPKVQSIPTPPPVPEIPVPPKVENIPTPPPMPVIPEPPKVQSIPTPPPVPEIPVPPKDENIPTPPPMPVIPVPPKVQSIPTPPPVPEIPVPPKVENIPTPPPMPVIPVPPKVQSIPTPSPVSIIPISPNFATTEDQGSDIKEEQLTSKSTEKADDEDYLGGEADDAEEKSSLKSSKKPDTNLVNKYDQDSEEDSDESDDDDSDEDDSDSNVASKKNNDKDSDDYLGGAGGDNNSDDYLGVVKREQNRESLIKGQNLEKFKESLWEQGLSPESKKYLINNFFRATRSLIKSDRELLNSLSEANRSHELRNLNIANKPGSSSRL